MKGNLFTSPFPLRSFPFVFLLFTFYFSLIIFSGCDKTTTTPPFPPATPDSIALVKETFVDPQECGACHPNHLAEWEQSMHHYAITDPVFRKLIEISRQRTSEPVDEFCIKCHTPLGPMLGETAHGFDFDSFSALPQNGIFCDACHLVNSKSIKSGQGLTLKNYRFDKVRRSTISDPQKNGFHESAFDNEFNFSRICRSCHNIEAPSGTFFLEETNIEWDESPYLGMGVECQDCHMPVYSGQAALGGPQRDDLNRHTFVGVDFPLVDFPGKTETIERVRALLENSVTLTVTAPENVSPDAPIAIDVKIKNDRTGHNIPSGSTFERQMWIELALINLDSGDTLFASGLLDSRGDLRNHHSEDVANGIVPEDTSLVLFRGIPLDGGGNELMFFWEAKSVGKIPSPRLNRKQCDIRSPRRINRQCWKRGCGCAFVRFHPIFCGKSAKKA